ncbi:MAG: LamG domain-containing protein [Pirellulales bacterium]|nr:LamG domain-containing protein [Pirellulales bacterium]
MRLFRGTILFVALIAAIVAMTGTVATAETLVCHYEFNDLGATDNLADTSGNGHVLIQSETAGGGQVVYDADRGSNVLLNPNGSSYQITAGAAGSLDFPAETSFTLAGWFKQEASDSTSAYIYALMLGYNGSEPIVTLGFKRDGTIVSYIETDYGDYIGTSNKDQMDIYTAPGTMVLDANYAFDGWHHVAVTYDRTIDIATIYLDGVAQQTTAKENTSTTTYSNGSVAYLSDTYGFSFDTRTEAQASPGSVSGYFGTDTSEFIGRLDDLRIYTGALSAGQIAALVPEPGSFVLLVCGALGLLVLRRK